MLYKIEDTIANPVQPDNSVFVGLASPVEAFVASEVNHLECFLGIKTLKSSENLSNRSQANQTSHIIKQEGESPGPYIPLRQTLRPTYNMPIISALSSAQQHSKGPFRSSKYEKGPDLASINCQNLQTKPLLEYSIALM